MDYFSMHRFIINSLTQLPFFDVVTREYRTHHSIYMSSVTMNSEKTKVERVSRKPTKEERESKEYRNRVLRAHKRMKTLTLEEVKKQVEELQKNC